MRPRVVLVDLGGTLIDFFGHTTPGLVLPLALASAGRVLTSEGRAVPPLSVLEARWELAAQSRNDPEVRPLEGRLSRTFGLEDGDRILPCLCRAFMAPLFAQARVFEDALPFLDSLREMGVEAVIVSNTTWGSPAELWRELLERTAIAPRVRGAVFCRDVGWRKPDRRVYVHALEVAGAGSGECLFVGDDPVWDVEGPEAAGIAGVLLDRRAEFAAMGYDQVINLRELSDRLQL